MTKSDKYGIVIDSGSSGSRIQIYKWENPASLQTNSQDVKVLNSVPHITQDSSWNHKITPGISEFSKHVDDLWDNHLSELIQFAESIVPSDQYSETPVFLLATAGMRLLSPKKQSRILEKTCDSLKAKSKFYIGECEDFVQVIDGEIEGIYGWIGLNYLMGSFDDNGSESIGFMDMGGASTQIAFVPSDINEIEKHKDDLAQVVLRNVNGVEQTWDVFVSTWLGFGANEARKRYLNQLIGLWDDELPYISDPCLPKGATMNYEYDDHDYMITGAGQYEVCLKTIYPLLLKQLPCKDDPCLFNGIHAPKLDFTKDKFVGISEYWYTANDIFHSGGEYNFQLFNQRVEQYCEDEWSHILENKPETSKLADQFYKDACFKASWVINILHEGFELPRTGIEIPVGDTDNELANAHVPFKSASSVNGDELSWTLGKILLFAASQIPTSKNSKPVGIMPSELSMKASGMNFVPGGSKEVIHVFTKSFFYSFITVSVIFAIIWFLSKNWANKLTNATLQNRFTVNPNLIKKKLRNFKNSFPFMSSNNIDYNDLNSSLEEGLYSPSRQSFSPHGVLRTRSAITLDQLNFSNRIYSNSNGNVSDSNFSESNILPKRNKSVFPSLDFENMRQSLKRSSSASVLKKPSYE